MKLRLASFVLSSAALVAQGGSHNAQDISLVNDKRDHAMYGARGDVENLRQDVDEMLEARTPRARHEVWKKDNRFDAQQLLKNQDCRLLGANTKYTLSEASASIDTSKEAPGCDNTSNNIYLSVKTDTVAYDGGNTSSFQGSYFVMEEWSACNSKTAKRKRTSFSSYEETSPTLIVADSLKTASYSDNRIVYIGVETCKYICVDPDFCYYDKCRVVSEESATGNVTVTWKAKGPVANVTSSNTYSGKYKKSSDIKSGQIRPTVATLSILYNGELIVIPNIKLFGELDLSTTEFEETYF